MRRPHTEAAAVFISDTRLTDLPPEVVHQVQRALLDALGCALGGRDTPIGQTARQMLRQQQALGMGTALIGTQLRAPASLAAMANAFSLNALDFDDTYEVGSNPVSHPGSSTVPAALAIAELRGASGADLLPALAVGWELAIRVAEAVQPSQARREQVWGVGTHQVFGAVGAAARLAGLRDERLISALGLAGISTPIASAWTASGWVKDAVAWPAATGVTAALLAKAGYHGPLHILDGQRSYYASAGSDLYRPERITDDLGTGWRLLRLSFKPYPACRWIHCALDLAAELIRRHRVEVDDVKCIEVSGFWELERLFHRPEPADMVDAQFSLPYTMAQILLGRPPGAEWFREEQLADPLVRALARRVVIRTDPEAERLRQTEPDRLLTTVSLETRDGQRWQASGEGPRGGPHRPLSDDDIEAKFLALAEPAIGCAAARAVVDWVGGLPDGSVGELLERVCMPFPLYIPE